MTDSTREQRVAVANASAHNASIAFPPSSEASRYDRLSPEARTLLDDYDELDLAEMLVAAQAAIARIRAVVHIADTVDVTDWQRGFRSCSIVALGALEETAQAATRATEAFEYGCPNCSQPVAVGKRAEHRCADLNDGDPDTRCGDPYRTDHHGIALCSRSLGHTGVHAGHDDDGLPYQWQPKPDCSTPATPTVGGLTEHEAAAVAAANLPSGTRITRALVDLLLRNHAPGLSRAEEDEAADTYEQAVARAESSEPRPGPEPNDRRQCSGEEGFCPAHGFHRHSVKQRGERCGHLSPETLLTSPPVACIKEPGHPRAHCDNRGVTWMPGPTAPARTEATEVRHERQRLYDAAVEAAMPAQLCDATTRVMVGLDVSDRCMAVADTELRAQRERQSQQSVAIIQRCADLQITLRDAIDAFEAYWAHASYDGPAKSAVQPKDFRRWRGALTPPQEQ